LEGLEKTLAIFFEGGTEGNGNKANANNNSGTGKTFSSFQKNAESKGREFKGLVVEPGMRSGSSVETGINFINENYEDGDAIVIYGYSYGGDAAVELADEIDTC
jgi:dienelactone hydrolase